MAKYRMDIFKPGRKPGHPAPLLWRRRDIYASDDAAAKAEAEDLYRSDASQRTLTNFYLCDSAGRSIYKSVRRILIDTANTAGARWSGWTGSN
jgi:hypothetical protein